ncbi:hypothetical protein [Rhizobium sp. BK491]|uniref:hypothetical protein n=1 Tax=Rhizobium sp. BK491 TaxID=2587009 RepID=UPI0017E4CFC2|nr:hypothetical protein [Rhizobium sp. BK491]MBB3571818.1 hypothetical protein [Rhizobium sp. BK491]
MKHKRGIDLSRQSRDGIVYLGPLLDSARTAFDDIPEWHAVGGHCPKCEREGWVQRFELARKWGNGTPLGLLAPKLRCLGCGNKQGNHWILGQLPR